MGEALILSLKLSAATTAVLLLLSLPLSYLLTFRSFPGRGAVEVALLLPVLLPPTVLGFYLIALLSPESDAFQNLSRRYLEVAYVFGYSPLETFFRVVLPNSWGGILTACTLVFAHTMGEFGVVLMVGGGIPGETKTLSIYIYDEVQALNYAEAHRASFLLLVVSLLSLSMISFLRRGWKRRLL